MKRINLSEKQRWLLSLIKQDRNLLLVTLVLGLLGGALGLSMAVFSQQLIDKIIPSQDTHYFLQAIAVLVVLLLLRLLVTYLQGYVSSLHGRRFNLRLIDSFFTKMIFLPKAFFDSNKTGTLITRMHDSGAIQTTVLFVTNSLILNLLNLIISAAFLFHYSSIIGFTSLFAFPLFFVSSIFFKNIMRHRLQAMYIANGENESNYIASIQNIDLIKTHNKQAHYIRQNARKYGNSLEKSFQSHLTGINFSTTSDAIGTLSYILILGISAYQALIGHMTIGEFSATVAVATGMLGPMSILGNALMHLQDARVAIDRMYEVMSAKSEFQVDEDQQKETPPHIHSIELRNISFSYDSDTPLLDNISFSAARGDMLCLFGRNGAGKSTLLNLLVALYRPLQGDILINGKSIADFSIMGLRQRIAIVSQQTKLFDGPLLNNICMSDDSADLERAAGLLHEKGFASFINRIQGAFNAQLSEDGNNLSGGQKQIIALARALFKNPDVLLVDEATAALDSESEDFVIKILRDFANAGGIVIMVSHRLKPTTACSRIIVIDNHRVQLIGNHHTLMQTDNFYSARYKSALDNTADDKALELNPH